MADYLNTTPFSGILIPNEGEGYPNMGLFVKDCAMSFINIDKYLHKDFLVFLQNNLIVSSLQTSLDGGTF